MRAPVQGRAPALPVWRSIRKAPIRSSLAHMRLERKELEHAELGC
ncbi:MAG TPA: hypothetical protein VK672_07820 [Solirubrobacteraceae bacterium]|nr:hypothetical protein [Solirubrobacteraceae bacterium]